MIEKACIAVWAVGLVLSVALTVKLNVPTAAGVPLMAPVVERVSPVGSDPVPSVHVYGVVPPVAVMVWA